MEREREAVVAIADAYHAAPRTSVTRSVRLAYSILSWYVLDRTHEAILAGWKFERDTTGDLPDIGRVAAERVLPVYDGAHGHPEFSDTQNFLFRFVHDVYGHFGLDGQSVLGFGFENETRACRRQQADFRAWARKVDCLDEETTRLVSRALYGEIVGQAACFEVDGRFPEQKAVIL